MRFSLLLLVLALPLAASAQTSFGLKAGLNAANISFSEDLIDEDFDGVDQRARLGLVAGVTADIAFTPSLSVRPELLYSQKGYAIHFDIDGDNDLDPFQGTATTKIDYLELPLLLAYTIPAGDGLMLGLEAGPTFAYKLNTSLGCSGDLASGTGIFTDLCDEGDVEDDEGIRDLDIGAALGLTASAGPFGVGVRYTNSIPSIASDEASDDGDFTARNQVLSVNAVYYFGR